MNKYLIFIIIGCILSLFTSVRSCREIQQDRDRLSDNQRALLEDVTYYRTQDSLSAASVERLTLTKNELEQYNVELAKTVKELGIKISRIEAASEQATSTEVSVITPVKDTTIIVREIPVLAKAFDWRDQWVSISGIINNDSVSCRVTSVDTLDQIIHRIPKKFWFIKWGTKAIRQEIVSKNPHTRMIYTKYLELKK